MQQYRVFVTYSHAEKDKAQRVREHLRKMNVWPMSDEEILGGAHFTDEIKCKIAYAHILVPILTEESSRHPWVHQEVGYALGMDVPILPLALGTLPEGLTHELHAVVVRPDLSDLEERLTRRALDAVIRRAREKGAASYECAADVDQREKMLVGYANDVYEIGGPQPVCQRMVLGSFSLPNRSHDHPVWDRIDGSGEARSVALRSLLRQEREAMEKHAREAGCDLIIDPHVPYGERGPHAKRARLETLVEFLDGMPDDKVRVAINRGHIDGSLFIIGDWFVSEAVIPRHDVGGGYRLTMFTRHAPTVLQRVDQFNRELGDYLLPGPSSRLAAIETIREILKTLLPA